MLRCSSTIMKNLNKLKHLTNSWSTTSHIVPTLLEDDTMIKHRKQLVNSLPTICPMNVYLQGRWVHLVLPTGSTTSHTTFIEVVFYVHQSRVPSLYHYSFFCIFGPLEHYTHVEATMDTTSRNCHSSQTCILRPFNITYPSESSSRAQLQKQWKQFIWMLANNEWEWNIIQSD